MPLRFRMNVHGKKSSVQFTEHSKTRGDERSLNKKLYNFRNFSDTMQNCLGII